MGAGEWHTGDVLNPENILSLIGADHVLIDVQEDLLSLRRVIRKVLALAADLGDPPEAEVTPWARQPALADQLGECARNFQRVGATGTVVVGGIFLFLQMTR